MVTTNILTGNTVMLVTYSTLCNFFRQVPFGQNTEKSKVEASRKSDKADDKKISIQSKIKSFLPSGNKQKSASQTREQSRQLKKISREEQSSFKQEVRRSDDEGQDSLSVKEPVTLLKSHKSIESHITRSTTAPRNTTVASPKELVQKDPRVNQSESSEQTLQESSNACNKHEVSSSIKSFQDTDRSSTSLWSTGKDTRPDSGYETLVGSENRRSVLTEEYGEIDISQVVLRKSRLSINSLTMNSENEVPKDEPVPVSKETPEVPETNQEQGPVYENHVDDSEGPGHTSVSSGLLQMDSTVESIQNHEGVDVVRREERAKVKPVPMRRRPSKKSTLIEVNVPRAVVEDDEADEKSDDTAQMSSDGDLLTEEQEEMLNNLTFDPIDEIPYKVDDVVKEAFSEIREIVNHRNTRTRNSFIPDSNPVDKLRDLLQQL